MLALALVLLLRQGQALEVTSSLERERVGVGEEFVFTIKAIGHSTAPFRVELPSFDGLALVDRSERTDVVVGTGQITRAYTLELHLRAEQVGTWTIAPVRIEQGIASSFTDPATVYVVSASTLGSGGSGLEPDLLSLVSRVPSPRIGRPSVYLVVSQSRLYVGEQMNVLTAAWLPRSLRLRLRQPPTLTPPALAGVWTTPRRAVPGAVASRGFEGETYDLYVSLQTAYPLGPGQLTIPPARLTWQQPARTERRESVESPPVLLEVLALPDDGKPAGFNGPVGSDLRIGYELGASSGRATVALPVKIVVNGAGALPLWPEPQVVWPQDVRVYREGTEDSPRLVQGRVGGSKTFRYGVLPDSAGSLALPALEYSYFDPENGRYQTARAPAIVVPVLEPPPVSERRNPLPLEEPAYQGFAERVVSQPGPLLVAALVGPLLLVAGAVLWRRRRPRIRMTAPEGAPAERLEALIEGVVPPGTPATRSALTRALRQAGLGRAEAERLVQLHLVLEAGRFGDERARARGMPAEREVETLLGRLPARLRRATGMAALGLSLLGTARAAAQSGAELYSRGEYAAAARAFRTESESAPPTAARWYDLAASEYLAHHDAQAVAALLAARALAPRDPRVRALWTALSREHEQLRRAGRFWVLSAEECAVLGAFALWLGSILFVLWRRQRIVWSAAFGIALCLGVLTLVLRSERAGARAILAGGVSLRASPHGLAPERATLPAFSVVLLERALGNWWLVRAPGGAQGWVPAEILARSPALN